VTVDGVGAPGTESDGEQYRVPPPRPPDDGRTWYAPEILAQRTVHPGVVTTVRERDGELRYETREPELSATGERALDRVLAYFEGAELRRPLTREGARELMASGFDPKYREAIDRLVGAELSPATRRAVDYHALVEVGCLGELTPHALDGRIEVADADAETLVVHTEDYAPCATDLADPRSLEPPRWKRTAITLGESRHGRRKSIDVGRLTLQPHHHFITHRAST
jgi:hypothetical protein